jgi:hypothetical protein
MAPTATWTPAEETALVDFLVDNRADAGDGGNFKKATFQKASNHLAPLLGSGAAKGVKSCQNKWAAFRRLYKVIRAIQEVSGWHWDDQTGASITSATSSSWDDYVKKHPAAKPFRNKGWVHLHKLALIMPSSTPGSNVYHAAIAQLAAPSTSPPPTTIAASSPVPLSRNSATPEPETVPVSVTRKWSCDDASPTRPAKRARAATGAEALLSMSNSMAGLGTALTAALAPPPATGLLPTPLRKTKAVTAAVRSERNWLTKTELVALIDFLRGDQNASDIYMALEEEDVRKEWVRIQLERLHVLVY